MNIPVPLSAQELRGHRRALRLSQTDLAKLLGVSSRQVQNWERGDTPISQTVTLAMCWLLLTLAPRPVSIQSAAHSAGRTGSTPADSR